MGTMFEQLHYLYTTLTCCMQVKYDAIHCKKYSEMIKQQICFINLTE